ncbi:MAG: hypothetical protein K0Q48_617 [Bacillota bacterium]|jgi:glyoxylase-like metal-dependent hydrolase (beta-lactamase superfamily II)|nr:hypothetical protein [Bacillota bacterium]
MKKWITKSGLEILRLAGGMSKVFAIKKENRFLLIDTGRKSSRRALLHGINRIEDSGCSLAALILTHAHYDHTANIAAILANHKVPVIINQRDAVYLESGRSASIRGTVPVIRFLVKRLEKGFQLLAQYQPVKSNLQVDDELTLETLGFEEVDLLYTPGHTMGSQSIIVDHEVALVGDTMFGIVPRSIFPPFAQDVDLLVNSWSCLLKTGCSVFLPSHGSSNAREVVEKEYRKYQIRRVL